MIKNSLIKRHCHFRGRTVRRNVVGHLCHVASMSERQNGTAFFQFHLLSLGGKLLKKRIQFCFQTLFVFFSALVNFDGRGKWIFDFFSKTRWHPIYCIKKLSRHEINSGSGKPSRNRLSQARSNLYSGICGLLCKLVVVGRSYTWIIES